MFEPPGHSPFDMKMSPARSRSVLLLPRVDATRAWKIRVADRSAVTHQWALAYCGCQLWFDPQRWSLPAKISIDRQAKPGCKIFKEGKRLVSWSVAGRSCISSHLWNWNGYCLPGGHHWFRRSLVYWTPQPFDLRHELWQPLPMQVGLDLAHSTASS